MRTAVGILAIVLALGSVFLLVRCARESVTRTDSATTTGGGRPGPGPGESDEVLIRLKNEIKRADRPAFRTDAERLADARAWIADNRPAGWPYTEVEAWMLANFEAMGEAEPRSAAWAMQNARIEVEMIRALDADRDGVVTEEEVEAFAAFNAEMQDVSAHPYLLAKFDANGDGVLDFDESPWQSMEALAAQGQGLADRARADLWDTDGDGVLSEQEKAAGAARALLNAKLFEDGHIEYVAEPGGDAAAEQEATRAKLLEEFGQETLQMSLDRQSRAAEMYLSVGLGEAMRLLDARPDYGAGDPGPALPDLAAYDPDGDGRLDEEQLARYQEAVAAWEHEMRLHSSRQFALFNQAQFEAALLEADFNHDTRLTPDEWDAHIENLLADRDAALFLHHYDLNGSGRVSQAELETFLAWYRAGSLRADANYDGTIDVRDLELVARRYQAQ